MSFVNDKLYKGYLRRNLPTIVSTVKVREIVIHLPCLTDHDRETIEAKRENNGNHDSMVVLLDCLKRRENWPEQLIEALEACDYPTIAAEIRREYNALRGVDNSNPSSPPTTVIRAHVHPAPSASHESVPESGANSQAAAGPPAEASAPPEPVVPASPTLEIPVQQEEPQGSAAQAPEPDVEPPRSTQAEVAPAPSTPPPSPEPPYNQVMTTTPLPQMEIHTHQEPVENSESDIQDVPSDNGGLPDQVSAVNVEVSMNSVDTPQPSGPAEQQETDPPPCPDLLQPTTTTQEVTPPQSPTPTQNNCDVTDGSSSSMTTPEKPPVQDTDPPVDSGPSAVPEPEETSEPPATQVVESSPQTETAPAVSPLPHAAGMNVPLSDDDSVCMSKPGQLLSIQSQNDDSPTIPAPSSPVEPYTGDSERLEISMAAATTANIPACCAVNSTTVNTAGALPCQENGIPLSHNEPQENHYESPCESLDTQEVQVHVVQVAEEPSIFNLDGQSSVPKPQILNGGAAKEITSTPLQPTNAADTVASVNNSPSCENCHPSEPAPADISPKTLQDAEKSSPRFLTTNTKYILTAVGVGACALLMAWKFKH